MTVTTERVPTQCPNHPHDPVVITTQNTTDPHQTRFKQYRCGAGCNTPLGWEFKAPPNIYLHGPGECQDERVAAALRCNTYHGVTALSVLALMTAAVICGMLAFQTPEFGWSTAARAGLIAGASMCFSAALALCGYRVRKKPPAPDFGEHERVAQNWA